MLLVALSSAQTTSKDLRGVGLFETTNFGGLNNGVSFAGGADALISGMRFEEQPRNNRVFMSTDTLTSTNQRFSTPELSRKCFILGHLDSPSVTKFLNNHKIMDKNTALIIKSYELLKACFEGILTVLADLFLFIGA